MNKKVLIPVLITIGIILVTIGITYAYFNTETIHANTNYAGTGKLNVIYSSDSNISGTLIPTSTKSGGISTQITIALDQNSLAANATVHLTLVQFPNVLATSALKWEIYKNSETSAYASGTFAGYSEGEIINLIENYELSTIQTTFTLYIWLSGTETDNSTQNQAFQMTLGATADVGETRSITATATSTTSSLTVTNAKKSSLADYKIYGNSIQASTPSPSSPVAIQTLGTYNSTTGKYDITINNTGKNLYNYLDFTNTNTTYWKPNQKVIVSQELEGYKVIYNQNTSTPGLIWWSAPHVLEVGKKYTITICVKGIDLTKLYFSTFSGNTLTYDISNESFTVLSKTITFSGYNQDFLLFFNSSPTTIGTGFIIKWMDIREGEVGVNTYNPYFNNTYTISLDEPLRCIDNVCDYIDYENQRIVRNIYHKQFDGTETYWNYNRSYTKNGYYSFTCHGSNLKYFLRDYGLFLSTHFEKIFNNWNLDVEGASTGWATNQTIWFKVNGTIATSLAAWEGWLIDQNTAGTPLEIYYQLKDPTYEAIALPEISTYEGTNIITVSDGIINPSKIEINYYNN